MIAVMTVEVTVAMTEEVHVMTAEVTAVMTVVAREMTAEAESRSLLSLLTRMWRMQAISTLQRTTMLLISTYQKTQTTNSSSLS